MRFLFSLVLLFSTLSIFSQDYEVTHYTVKDGLMSNDVKGIFQDSLGVIWVANGLGFTKFYGDKILNVESPSSNYSLSDITKVGCDFYMGDIQITSNGIKKVNIELRRVSVEKFGDLRMEYETSPLIDKNGYYWAYNYLGGDSIFIRTNLNDTTNIHSLLSNLDLKFNFEIKFDYGNLISDNHGNIWIRTTNNQIHRFDFATQRIITFKHQIPFLYEIKFINDNDFYAIGRDSINSKSLLYRYINDKFDVISLNDTRINMVIAKGKVYLFYSDGLYTIEKNDIKLIKPFSNLRDNQAVVSETGDLYFVDHTNNLFVIYKYDGVQYKQIYTSTSEVIQLYVSQKGSLWASTRANGLLKIQVSNIENKQFPKLDSYPSGTASMRYLYQLNSEVALFTCSSINRENGFEKSNGIYALKNMRWIHLFEGEYTGNITVDDENNFYFTGRDASFNSSIKFFEFGIEEDITRNHELYKIDSSFDLVKLNTISNTQSFNNRDLSVRHLKWFNGQLYVFTNTAIFIYNENNTKKIPIPQSNNRYFGFPVSKNVSYQVINYGNVDGKNRRDSLVKFNLINERFEPFFENLQSSYKKGLYEIEGVGENKIIRTGSLNLIISDSTFIDINEVNTLGNNYFSKSFIFENHVYGFFRDIGIAKVDLNTGITKILPFPYSSNIKLSPDSNSFWLYNETYIKQLPLTVFENKEEFSNIWTQAEGYKAGVISFSGDSIMRIYNKDELIEKKIKNRYIPAAPAIHFTNLRLNYENFNWSKTATKIDSFWGNIMPYNMELNYDLNHLTFDYQGISHSNKKPLIYFHKLVGLDTNFVGTNSKSATYSNLKPGHYTFKVFAQDENESKSETLECSFTVKPPFWQTWWFISLCVLGIGGALYSGYNYNVKRLKARQEELESEVEQATKEIRHQKDEIEESHREITDSINYAERIQRSFLATNELLNENLNEYFVYFNPKEAVSGDFYWAGKLANGNFALVNADSTGHGVPGAIMSILNISSIEKAVDQKVTSPAEIFNETRTTIIQRLKNDGSKEGGKDGMDASLIAFNADKTIMIYVAAQNPIWVIRDGVLSEIKPEKMPVGKHDNDNISFVGGEVDIQEGDVIYTLTDGFQDQFGGSEGKKFMVKKMREYVLSISNLSMAEQHLKIKETFANWKGDLEQIDDVCVIGVKV
jgi:serine phosphatase RsbU (regulator of sigma subunit)